MAGRFTRRRGWPSSLFVAAASLVIGAHAAAQEECGDGCYRLSAWSLGDNVRSDHARDHFVKLVVEIAKPAFLVAFESPLNAELRSPPFEHLVGVSDRFDYRLWAASPDARNGTVIAFDEQRVDNVHDCSVETDEDLAPVLRARVLQANLKCSGDGCPERPDSLAIAALEMEAHEDTAAFRRSLRELLNAIERSPCRRRQEDHMQILYIGTLDADCRDPDKGALWRAVRRETFAQMGLWPEGQSCQYPSTSLRDDHTYDGVSSSRVTFVMAPEPHGVHFLCAFQSQDEAATSSVTSWNHATAALQLSVTLHEATDDQVYGGYHGHVGPSIPVSIGISRRETPKEPFEHCTLELIPRQQRADP